MFKVGDWVRLSNSCGANNEVHIRRFGIGQLLVVDTSAHLNYSYVKLQGHQSWWDSKRFELDKNTIVTNILNDL